MFSLQHANGILGLDLALLYDPRLVTLHSVTTTGIGSNLQMVRNDRGEGTQLALYGTTAMQGSGPFLQVTYKAMNPGAAVPFQVAAQANEGQIPIVWAPRVPGAGQAPPSVAVDR